MPGSPAIHLPQFSRCLKFLQPSVWPPRALPYRHLCRTETAVPSSQPICSSVIWYSVRPVKSCVKGKYQGKGHTFKYVGMARKYVQLDIDHMSSYHNNLSKIIALHFSMLSNSGSEGIRGHCDFLLKLNKRVEANWVLFYPMRKDVFHTISNKKLIPFLFKGDKLCLKIFWITWITNFTNDLY